MFAPAVGHLGALQPRLGAHGIGPPKAQAPYCWQERAAALPRGDA